MATQSRIRPFNSEHGYYLDTTINGRVAQLLASYQVGEMGQMMTGTYFDLLPAEICNPIFEDVAKHILKTSTLPMKGPTPLFQLEQPNALVPAQDATLNSGSLSKYIMPLLGSGGKFSITTYSQLVNKPQGSPSATENMRGGKFGGKLAQLGPNEWIVKAGPNARFWHLTLDVVDYQARWSAYAIVVMTVQMKNKVALPRVIVRKGSTYSWSPEKEMAYKAVQNAAQELREELKEELKDRGKFSGFTLAQVGKVAAACHVGDSKDPDFKPSVSRRPRRRAAQQVNATAVAMAPRRSTRVRKTRKA